MRFFLSNISGEIDKAIRDIERPVAQAATAAVKDAADEAVSKGRTELATAGFSTRSQKQFTSKLYPKGGKVSLKPAARVYHRIGYFSVFEKGATILGKPKLWIPLDSVPMGGGGRRLTAKQYVQRVGPLHSVNIPGKPPLLFGKAGRSTILSATQKITRLRKGAVGRGIFGASVPLFVGVDRVKIRKRFGLYAIIDRAADRLAEFYEQNVRP
jgi:hypothetical protein